MSLFQPQRKLLGDMFIIILVDLGPEMLLKEIRLIIL